MERDSKSGEGYAEFDDVFQLVNSFGQYQKILYFTFCFLILLMCCPWGILLFAMGTPNFHCATPNSTCPPNQCCDNCTDYTFDGPFTSTVTEWGLVCGRAYLNAIIQSSFLVGMIFGALVSGVVSDTYGRKPCTFIFLFVMALPGFASSFVDCISFFAFLWFIVGFGLSGFQLAQYIYIMEMVGPKIRTLAGNINWFYWSVGFFLICMIAYLIRDWRTLVLVAMVPGVIVVAFWRLFPESPRWLIAHNRLDEAQAVLMRFGGQDGKTIDEQKFRDMIQSVREDQITRERNKTRHTLLDLVRTPKLRKWSLVVGYNWFAVSFLSNAMNLYLVNMPGSLYLNFTVVQTVATLQQPIIWILLQRFGRRIPHSCVMSLVGLLCFSVLIVPERLAMVRTGFYLAAVGISFSMWTDIYMITTELFPTVIRNTAQGAGDTVGRVGAMAVPYIVMLGRLPNIGTTVPMLIFGSIAILAGVVSLWIPETLNANMHQTIEEAEAAKEDYGIPCGCRRRRPGKEDEEKEKKSEETGESVRMLEQTNENNGVKVE